MRRLVLPKSLFLLAAIAPGAQAQQAGTPGPLRAYTLLRGREDGDRAMLGVSTRSDGKRDTLGLLVVSVTPDGPAEKAGIEEGNRIASINGVNLKLSRDDAGDPDMAGVAVNRLTRELRRVTAGDEVTLDVWASGRARTVKVKTVAADDLAPFRRTRDDAEERAAFGISLSTSGSKRDTLGVFVSGVTEGGPAEKAGIVEGDRIARINGVDLRTPKEDIGDGWASSNRIQRLQREVRKLKPGEAADLVVVSGGRSRTVRVTAIRARDLPPGNGFAYSVGDGGSRFFAPKFGLFTPKRGVMISPRPLFAPRVRVLDDGLDLDFGLDELRSEIERIGPELEMQLERELPRAMDEVRRSMQRLREEMPALKERAMRSVII